MNDIKKIFGKNVRKYRKQLKISQEQLAEKASLHRTYIGSVERGERNISLENIIKLSEVLGVSPAHLFHNDTIN
ncbi:helix-turn-helix domain-containing protein [Entomomonas asaccharolytica]|uniref:Helix-turn-helix transcriptional regulator n=1 Tax=Entomomonas asaccharolytica TaxID=2785331 RepID=A0A974NDZ5_9GAMM|nr:helix-turn-helix transcriptional regulator [Entomomonas asaccharolytica]QQP84788.1 helix-turn-helix transcriptional regulator [Entomomonas asaccharolytica]